MCQTLGVHSPLAPIPPGTRAWFAAPDRSPLVAAWVKTTTWVRDHVFVQGNHPQVPPRFDLTKDEEQSAKADLQHLKSLRVNERAANYDDYEQSASNEASKTRSRRTES
jgi:hypothetical protein